MKKVGFTLLRQSEPQLFSPNKSPYLYFNPSRMQQCFRSYFVSVIFSGQNFTHLNWLNYAPPICRREQGSTFWVTRKQCSLEIVFKIVKIFGKYDNLFKIWNDFMFRHNLETFILVTYWFEQFLTHFWVHFWNLYKIPPECHISPKNEKSLKYG